MCVRGVGGVRVDTCLSLTISGVFSVSASFGIRVVVSVVVSVSIRSSFSDSRNGTAATAARGSRKRDAKEGEEGGAAGEVKTSSIFARVRSCIRTS